MYWSYLDVEWLQTHFNRYFRRLGLSSDEYIVLNTIISHLGPGITRQNLQLVTGLSADIIDEALKHYLSMGLIDDEVVLDANRLIHMIRSVMPLYDLWSEEQQEPLVQMVPFKQNDVSGFLLRHYSDKERSAGMVLSRKSMKEIATNILNVAEHLTDEQISELNDHIEKQKQALNAMTEALKHETKSKREPSKGEVWLYQIFPSGTYRFTRCTKGKESKLEGLKRTYGDHITVIHSIETDDVDKLYYFFIKTFDHLRVNTEYEFQLTSEEVKYVQDERFPPDLQKVVN